MTGSTGAIAFLMANGAAGALAGALVSALCKMGLAGAILAGDLALAGVLAVTGLGKFGRTCALVGPLEGALEGEVAGAYPTPARTAERYKKVLAARKI
jgi:hypothetical protein